MSRGFSLVEVLVVVAIIAVLMGIMVPLMQAALLRAHVGAMAHDCRTLHTAFKQHYLDFDMYPNSTDPPAFDLATFEPLISQGYYSGDIVPRLEGLTADGYDSPDDTGVNQEFWIEMTLDFDPSVRFLVADSDDAPLSGGQAMDGVYLYRDGVLRSLNNPIDK
jgi:prepilin-type N-terminal cleavage/methylation domain-containing protein